MDLKEKTGTVSGPDGLKIFYRTYGAEGERGRLVIAHGLGEHSGRYGNVLRKILPGGISVWAMDLRGHGKSEGRKGRISSFDDYITDLRSGVALARRDIPGDMKCFLLGHSMGGLIALIFALRFPEMINGLIISSPSLGIAGKVPFLKRALGKVMSSVLPGMALANGLDISKLSHDEAVVRGYADDPLVHDRVSTRWFTEFLKAMEEVNRLASRLAVPILLQLAGDDYLTDVEMSKAFFDRLNVTDRTLQVYEGMYHEIYNETEELRSRPLDDLYDWLERHL